ncbi:hypothetical protein NM208_g15812 [Fusarium decemcellulare]|uniref:Uncharacterized protein n=1 Tax=Fusarium decemcellulare TaxID=57161 RepID=A0ACC1REK1_9HYPO|nr:hypothetical protein NM208_g15812 [Fusarium decemcellulare]
MVIGLLAIAAIPTVTGVGNAISAQKKQNANLSKEQEKFHMSFVLRQDGKVQELGTGVVTDKKTLPSRATSFSVGTSSTPARRATWGW